MMNILTRIALLVSAIASIGVRATPTVTYYHNDLLGSPVVATNSSGQVLWRESYRPYGERITNDVNSGANKIWYTTRRQDSETGLVYMGARYYDAVVGRFMGVDPKGFDEANIHSFNRYGYANNNPYRFHDPNGMWAEDIVLGVPSLAIGAVSMRGNLGQGNYAAATVDGIGMLADAIAIALPGVPGGAGFAIAATRKISSEAAGNLLSDAALVCRGGACTAEAFATGKGVSIDAAGKLNGVSVTSGAGKSVEELTAALPHPQVGVTTVGQIRRAGGEVVASGTAKNPNHCTMCGVTPKTAEELFTPTRSNPNVP